MEKVRTYLSHGVNGGLAKLVREIVPLDKANTMLTLRDKSATFTILS